MWDGREEIKPKYFGWRYGAAIGFERRESISSMEGKSSEWIIYVPLAKMESKNAHWL